MPQVFTGKAVIPGDQLDARFAALVVGVFIDFLCDHTDVTRIEAVTRGMANSAFRR